MISFQMSLAIAYFSSLVTLVQSKTSSNGEAFTSFWNWIFCFSFASDESKSNEVIFVKTIVTSRSKNSTGKVDEADSDEEDEQEEEECWNFASTQDDTSDFVRRPSKWRMGS